MALERSGHLRGPEPDGPAELERRDHPGNPPLVELAAADLEEGGELGLGQEFKFVARRGWVRVHARAKASTRRPRVVTNGDNRRAIRAAITVRGGKLPSPVRGDNGDKGHCGSAAADQNEAVWCIPAV